ncbi:hypothetical protein RhiirC2_791770 [Rhizophagus irregularis]|uniref:F-box domain-containing protein n=1 Tax=Rhizophagus irregularis TaxID=588596 RepID=A0A2N1MIJ9_9GLOM|nr:hypothetical protein RhiirC2_791770 [Rhizophagus irregularis]
MTLRLPIDCLNEILEWLEDDKMTLYSCLLVNRFWCEISVRILWKNYFGLNNKQRLKVFNTLISCLPKDSKELIKYKNENIILTQTLPLFNYPSFCKILSIGEIIIMTKLFLESERLIHSESLRDLIGREILKMFMKQIPSLKKLIYYSIDGEIRISKSITLTQFLGAKESLMDLTELRCSSDITSEFFNQLSQICHNIQTLIIEIEYSHISNGLKDLISSQNNLKYLSLTDPLLKDMDWSGIISSLTKHSITLTKLHIQVNGNKELSFINKFKNLQELFILFESYGSSNSSNKHFKDLQYTKFDQLQILKLDGGCPKFEILVKFLENNGKNLKEFHVNGYGSLNLIIAKYCPNLLSLYTLFPKNEMETLKFIFNNCQKLESIKILCGEGYLTEKEILKIVAIHSPKNFHELKLYNFDISGSDFEPFFINWKDRVPLKSISFIIECHLNVKRENIELLEKYKNLGIIKKFEINVKGLY